MNFSELLAEQDLMTRGLQNLTLSERATLSEAAAAFETQQDDLLYVLADLTEEDLDDFTLGLNEAIAGLLEAVEKAETLTAVADIMEDSDNPEAHKIAVAIKAMRRGYGDVGRLLKSLKIAAKGAHEASWEH